jgi:signal transduction histidine kinase
MINLLSNACKYSGESQNIGFSSTLKNGTLKIVIADKGIGIPDDDKQHMFERFFRAKNSTNIQGTGLGLNIVKKYTDLLGGQISFKSKVGKGSSFTVKLPSNINT